MAADVARLEERQRHARLRARRLPHVELRRELHGWSVKEGEKIEWDLDQWPHAHFFLRTTSIVTSPVGRQRQDRRTFVMW
jgi:hypothetical protein